MGCRRDIDWLHGDLVRLHSLCECDVTHEYVGWLQDPEVNRYMETRHKPHTMETVTAFVERVNSSDDEFLFGIYLQERHIGNIKVGPIKNPHGIADVSFFIGDKSCWGMGCASDAIMTVSRFAAHTLNLRKLNAVAYSVNKGSIGALQTAGFVIEATRPNHYILDGKPADICELGLFL